MEAGADTRTITPSLDHPVYLAGFQGNRVATRVAHDLRVRTLALRAGGGRPFALAVCDLVGLVREDTLAIRRALAGIDAVVASTHTHSGPDTIGLWGPDDATRGADDAYLERVRGSVVASIRAAVDALGPAVLRLGDARAPGLIRNFRDPGILDEQVVTLAADRPDGTPIATLVNVPVHPEVLDGESTLVSPDAAGATCRAIERERGGVAVWASGGLGGMQSPDTETRTLEEVERFGEAFATAALASLGDERVEPPLSYRHAEVRLPMWNPTFRLALEAGILRGDLMDGHLTVDVSSLELGPARMAFLPGEVLPALAMHVKELLACPAPFLVGLANDELGYILPREAFVEPEDWNDPDPHYEESMSVGPETGPLLVAALERLLGTTEGRAPA